MEQAVKTVREALTIPEFCVAHHISRSLFYSLQRENKGPRLMKLRKRTLITLEAAAEWRRRMEDLTAKAV
jgi:predicted DNA-binding transcriptional regulator AlpA